MKLYPNHTLENALRDKGISCPCLWEQKTTAGGYLVAYLVQGVVVIVQTYPDGRGWQAFVPVESNKVSETVDEIIRRTTALQAA